MYIYIYIYINSIQVYSIIETLYYNNLYYCNIGIIYAIVNLKSCYPTNYPNYKQEFNKLLQKSALFVELDRG